MKRGLLGIKGSEMTPDMAKAFNTDAQRGAFVSEVLPKSAAAKAGIKAGDILVSVDGKPVNSFAELRAKVGTTAPGKTLKVGLLRDGKPQEVSVTLDNRERLDQCRNAVAGAAGFPSATARCRAATRA